MLCSKCKKRVAVVFVTKMENGKQSNEGYCIPCAREMNLPNIRSLIDRMGMTEEDMEAVNESMAQLIGDGDMFEPGGTAPMPFFQLSGDKDGKDEGKKQKGAKGKKAQEQPEKEQKRKFLEGFCINLSERVRQGKVDRIIGRDKEIYRAVQILNRRIKNNPCLIGEAGVGKTAIAEGLAYALQNADFIPPRLRKKEIHLLDLTALVAGTQFRGQFESRVKGLVDEVKREGNIILFIDEVHNLIGTGESEGGMNAANILKPALSRGEIQVIGATTFGEYRKYIEKDAALERRFQTINVDEPSVAETAAILEGIKGYYEEHHGVKLDDGLCYKAAVLAGKYITDRFMPDKAIDLIDEACSTASIKNKEAAKLAELEEKIAELSAREEELTSSEAAEGDGEKNEIFKEIADLRVERCRLEEDVEKLRQKNLIMPVTIAELASVIEMWTGISAERIKEQEFDKLALLEERIKRRVVGQDEAVEAVVRAVKRARAGLTTRRRPASFVFMGPTGVGKTELVRVMAEELFDTKENFIRLDMSEYMEKHSVSKLVGSPPGYIGYDEQGQLTERVRRKPNSIILFDEIEKAHADVLNILLQILDEGRLTDAHGRRVNFENTIVVMTSNAGSGTGVSTLGFTGGGGGSFDKTKAEKALKEIMRPELLSRIDDVIFFNRLTLDNYKDIAGLMLDELAEGMKEKGLSLEYGDDVKLWLAVRAEGSQQSARELRRLIRRNVEDEVAELMVTGKISSGVALSAEGENLKITAK